MSKHTLRFYPLGNADTTLISLANGKQILWDYAHMKAEGDEDDERCDLPEELDKHVTGDFDVVTFTHGDRDHINRFSEYFYLKHALKYQSNDRKKINELWVPAAILLDKQSEDEAKILKAEARHRLRNKEGVLVFSKPQKFGSELWRSPGTLGMIRDYLGIFSVYHITVATSLCRQKRAPIKPNLKMILNGCLKTKVREGSDFSLLVSLFRLVD